MSQTYDAHPAPWQVEPLHEWSIVGMNHYHLAGVKRLFVAMTKGDKCIVEEGKDNEDLWERLADKAFFLSLKPCRECKHSEWEIMQHVPKVVKCRHCGAQHTVQE